MQLRGQSTNCHALLDFRLKKWELLKTIEFEALAYSWILFLKWYHGEDIGFIGNCALTGSKGKHGEYKFRAIADGSAAEIGETKR